MYKLLKYDFLAVISSFYKNLTAYYILIYLFEI